MTETTENITAKVFNTKDGYSECDHCQSILSPAAYFVRLMGVIEKHIPANKLKERRPDLFNLKLDCDSTNKTKLYLEIINEVIEQNLDGDDTLKKVATEKYPLNLPANINLIKIRAYLKDYGINLADVYKALIPESDNFFAESLGLSLEEWSVITDAVDPSDEKICEVYGINKKKLDTINLFINKLTDNEDTADLRSKRGELVTKNAEDELGVEIKDFPERGDQSEDNYKDKVISWRNTTIIALKTLKINNVDTFVRQTKVKRENLSTLFKCYNELHDPTNKVTILSDEISNLDQTALGFLHRFIRFSNKTGWSFNELKEVLIAISGKEISKEALKKIVEIKILQEKLNKPLIEVCKLYVNNYTLEKKEANKIAESLCFASKFKKSHLKNLYGIEEPLEPLQRQSVSEFMLQSGMDYTKIERILRIYDENNEICKDYDLSSRELEFLDFFPKLVKEIELLLTQINSPEKKNLKDLKIENNGDSIILQKVLGVNNNELESLVNYNNFIASGPKLLSAYSQVMLAKLMEISIAELIQILIREDIGHLTSDNIEKVIEFNDWLNNKSLKIDQLNTLINSHVICHENTEEISNIQKEIKEREEELKEELLAIVQNNIFPKIDQLKSLVNSSVASTDDTKEINKIQEEIQKQKKELKEKEEISKKDLLDIVQNSIFPKIDQLNNLINSLISSSVISHNYADKINNIQKAIQKQKKESEEKKKINEEELLAIIQNNISVNPNVLTAAYQFTKKRPTNLRLLRLESLDKSIVQDVEIVDNRAIFLGENKIEVHDRNSAQYEISNSRDGMAVATIGEKTIFFGGERSSNESIRRIDIYNNKTREKLATKRIEGNGRHNAASAVIGKKAIFFGGKTDNRVSDKIDVYDDSKNSWTTHTTTSARENVSVAVVGNKAIFFGGTTNDNKRSSIIDIYNSKTEKWQEIEYKASEARKNASVAVVDDKAIFFGGTTNDNKRSSIIDIYNSKTEEWQEIEYKASEARKNAAVAVVNNQVIFFGGKKDNENYSLQIDIYDSKTDKWQSSSLDQPTTKDTSVTVVGTKAIFFTPKNESKFAGRLNIYDSALQKWVKHVDTDEENESNNKIEIENGGLQYSEKISLYDSKAKSWNAIDVYKNAECTSIKPRHNAEKIFLKFNNSNDKREYSVKFFINHDVTIEELLNNIDVFKALNLNAEDIKSIDENAELYNIKKALNPDAENAESAGENTELPGKATWTKEQIQNIANYKALSEKFSGNEINLAQYTGWLKNAYDENKIIEKVSHLTGWDKGLLGAINEKDNTVFKKWFSKDNYIDSLLEADFFMSLVESPVIDGKNLLKFKDLKNKNLFSDSAIWNTYIDIEKNLSESINLKEKVKNSLEDQKRNILVDYILHTKNISNMRDLYAHLLIDVEMTDCAKISPLKAGLNSVQLYIHRCMLGLEEGVEVNDELTEEKWELLSSYRMWEANKKISLYPENYLDPTLRKTASPEYKTLHDTLMQGSITDEAVSTAYLKYFEDFTTLTKLKGVHNIEALEEGQQESVKKWHIIARTIAEPCIYYYRCYVDCSAYASHWKKIEAQITAKTAKMIYAFGKLFIFWLHRIEKREKKSDYTVTDDSTLEVYYIFQKADGLWSEQQKLPDKIHTERSESLQSKIDAEQILYYHNHISQFIKLKRKYNKLKNDQETYVFNDRDEYKLFSKEQQRLIKYHISPLKEKKHSNDQYYCTEEVLVYCENAINELKKKIKELEDKSFHGNLIVNFDHRNNKITVRSIEKGFHNIEFDIEENFDFKKTHKSFSKTLYLSYKYADKKNAILAIEKRYQVARDNIDNEIQAEENKLNRRKESKNKEKLLKEDEQKDEIATQDTSISEIEQDIEKSNANENEIRDSIDNQNRDLDALQEKNSLQDNLSKKSLLVASANFLKQRIEKVIKLNSEAPAEDDGANESVDPEQKTPAAQSNIEQLNDLNSRVDKLKSDTNILTEVEIINESRKKEESELQNELDEIIGKLDALQDSNASIRDNLSKKPILRARIEHLKNRLTKYKILISDKRKILLETFKSEIGALDNKLSEIRPREIREQTLNEDEAKEIELVNKLHSDKLEDIAVTEFIDMVYKKVYTQNISVALVQTLEQRNIDNEKFMGLYGAYLWEIFFHIPTLIAHLFNQEGKFSEARKWYQCIFDASKKNCDAWKFIPFKGRCPESGNYENTECIDDKKESLDLVSPYIKAHNRKTSFEKYIIASYVDNLIDWGDMLFAQSSWEGINQATMLYIQAWNLLGVKPKQKEKQALYSKTFCQLSDEKYDICTAEAEIPNDSSSTSINSTCNTDVYESEQYCRYFCTPENKEFIALWSRIADRLYKIRHCLDIRGRTLELPLFQPPIDPRQLAAGGGAFRLPKIQVPHYRFGYMMNYAKSVADTVTQIGSEFLGVLEKKDAEEMNILYNKQEGIMANLMTSIKEKAIDSLKEEASGLKESLDSAEYRKEHYGKLINEGYSSRENDAMDKSKDAIYVLYGAIAMGVGSVIAHLVPTIFGFSIGGLQPGSSVDAATGVLQTTSNALANISQNISTVASYQRRTEDWELQQEMATHDVKQIGHQISANKINQQNAEQDLKAHQESIKQIKEKGEFFKSKFTNKELYSWMKGELARLYYQSYKLAVEVARQAEWAYQYETDDSKTFIQHGYWNSLKKGLLAGGKLKFDLEQMNKEYHDSNERRLQITKVISLKQLNPMSLFNLKKDGECSFSLTEKLFDLDFPGHYRRKINGIKITIPAVVGPYENVHATLQQTSNKLVLKPNVDTIKFLLEGEGEPEDNTLRESWKNNQQIAISRGDQDSGLFEFNFNDERYLPFEGTGAVSDWKLKLPKATNRFDLNSVSDVIIHIDYTALDGGEKLSTDVQNIDKLKYYSGTLVANLSSIYPDKWQEFKRAEGNSSALNIKLSPDIFPIHIKDPEIDLDEDNKLYVLPVTPDTSAIKLKINNDQWKKSTMEIANPALEIGENWKVEVSNTEINKIEEIVIIIPYRAQINW